MTAGDGEGAVEGVPDGEHLRHRQIGGGVPHRPLVVLEALADLPEAGDELVVTDAVAEGARPEAAAQRFDVVDRASVVRGEERRDVTGGDGQ
jgi:hypothetical protein